MGHPAFFEDPDYAKIVEAHKANPAQIVISWLVQRGIPTIPKSANVERQKANITVSVNNQMAVHQRYAQTSVGIAAGDTHSGRDCHYQCHS